MASAERPLAGRICLLTGATSGIGRVAARELARLGATMLLAVRDATQGEAVAAEIRRGGGSAEVHVADLARQRDVRDLARAVAARHPCLHILINNAGVLHLRRRVTADGIEATLAVNHVAPFLLSTLLLDALRAAAPSRVVNVTSETHRLGGLRLDDLQWTRRYSGARAYTASKYANVLFTYELARRLAGTGVTVNCLHPGGVRTGIWRELSGWRRVPLALYSPLLLTPERAARYVVRLAAHPGLAAVTGKYFKGTREARSAPGTYDAGLARAAWDATEALTARPR